MTVGISRSEDALFGVPLVKATLAAGAAPDTLGYRALRTLGALDEAVAEVLGSPATGSTGRERGARRSRSSTRAV